MRLATLYSILGLFSLVDAAAKCRLKEHVFNLGSSGTTSGGDGGTVSGGGGNGSGSGSGAGSGNGGSDGGSNACGTRLASAWYPGWQGQDPKFSPEKIQWSKYTSIVFSFAIPTANPGTISLDDTSQAVLPAFVQQANDHNVLALLSIGGWSGSTYFSTSVGSSTNRTSFTKAVLDLVSQYSFDGIDFDWEYPGKQGAGCNFVSSSDSANFLKFLQGLRQDAVGAKLYLSAAVAVGPFTGSDGSPMSDVSEFAKVLDHIAIMAYDINGSWGSTVGANAPLDDSCETGSSAGQGSAMSAVKSWTDAKFPANKIVLGTASYGHSFYVPRDEAFDPDSGELKVHPSFNASLQPAGNEDDGYSSSGSSSLLSNAFRVNAVLEGSCSGDGGEGGGTPLPSGIFDFYGLIDVGFLNTDGTVKKGISYVYDDCSQTPFVYNSTSQVMVSYDDATSFAAKGKFIKSKGLKGFAMWTDVGDYNNILVDSIESAMKC